jgi:hypothetical protein
MSVMLCHMETVRTYPDHCPLSGNWYYFYFTPPALLVGRSGLIR